MMEQKYNLVVHLDGDFDVWEYLTHQEIDRFVTLFRSNIHIDFRDVIYNKDAIKKIRIFPLPLKDK